MEKTYVMLKPDAIARGLAGRIIDRIESKGYLITDMKVMMLDPKILKEHYAHVADQPFYPRMERYMTSGPVWAMIVEGDNVIRGIRILMGATEEAPAGTIRGDFAKSSTENLIHGSDTPENAIIEIKRFFGKEF